MKLRSILFNTVIFVGIAFFAADITSVALRNRHLVDLDIFSRSTNAEPITLDKTCTDAPKIEQLSKAAHPGLQRLAEYQDVCQSKVTDTLMVFTDMPKDSIEAEAKAQEMAATLKEFAAYGVQPLVIVEPVTTWGFVDFVEFRDGFYDQWIRDYFAALKGAGVTDQQMGIWVPFPEPNLPYWNHQSAKPEDFGLVANKYVGILKQAFPGVHASILLNSASYDNSDFAWSNEEYVSLLPYVRKIDPELFDSFGMQGFPWTPRAGDNHADQFDASKFLNADLAAEAANFIGVDHVWLNTASFMQKYTLDERTAVTITPETRQAIMMSISHEATKLQTIGFTVSVNLFAQDKSEASEETNWSYWAPGKQRTSPHSIVFRDFASNLHRENIALWLFDQ